MVYTVVAVIIFLWISACLNVLREYERAVTFRLGRLLAVDKGPGLIFILWPIDKIIRVSLREVAWEMPPQDVITRDNVSVKVNAVVFFRVLNAQKAICKFRTTATYLSNWRKPAFVRCWVKWNWTICFPSAKSSIRVCKPFLMYIRSPGALR